MSFLSLLFPKLPFPDHYTVSDTQPLRNIRCVLQYEGTAYQGWQKQPTGLTIQGVVEQCITRLTDEPIRVKASGRTDAGVHALMQTINFFTHRRLPPEKLSQALNSLLPKDIGVIYADEVKTEFDAQFCVKSKTYIYFILNSGQSSPFLKNYTWQIRRNLDLAAMQEASRYLIGKHNFAAFMASGSEVKNTVRNVICLEIKEKPPFVILEIEANGFLRHMVRNIVGTLVEVGLHKRKAQEIKSILASQDRRLAGINAPAKGLFLKEVKY